MSEDTNDANDSCAPGLNSMRIEKANSQKLRMFRWENPGILLRGQQVSRLDVLTRNAHIFGCGKSRKSPQSLVELQAVLKLEEEERHGMTMI